MPAAQLRWGQFSFPFSKGWVTSSHSLALDHNFLLSPQKPYFLPDVLLSCFFHLSKDSPALLITQRKKGEHLQPFSLPLAQEKQKQLSPGQLQLTGAQPIACGSHNSP